MNIKKPLAIMLGIVAVFLLIVGIMLLNAGLTTSQMGRRVCYILCAALIATLSGLLIYFLWLARDHEPNYFLFDREAGGNMAVEQLQFPTVNERMTQYITTHFESNERLWLGNAWADGDRFGANGEYRSLVAYKMLYDLIAADQPAAWRLFSDASSETVIYLCDALARCGEKTLSQKILYVKKSCGGDGMALRGVLAGSKRYLQGKMTGLVRRNIEWFYYT